MTTIKIIPLRRASPEAPGASSATGHNLSAALPAAASTIPLGVERAAGSTAWLRQVHADFERQVRADCAQRLAAHHRELALHQIIVLSLIAALLTISLIVAGATQ
jgi:hypothetical protein